MTPLERKRHVASLPSFCGECLFLGCCKWIEEHDTFPCKNKVKKKDYLKRWNREAE